MQATVVWPAFTIILFHLIIDDSLTCFFLTGELGVYLLKC